MAGLNTGGVGNLLGNTIPGEGRNLNRVKGPEAATQSGSATSRKQPQTF
jgi:hypothetical protein